MKILLAGESWVIHSTHVKGFDSFTTTTYEEGGNNFITALKKSGIEVDYMPCHVASESFPDTADMLSEYGAVILSDIGSNTLLLQNETFSKAQKTNNKLKAIKEYVANGGGFAMMGGYLSFQGFEGKAKYIGTPIEEILPVTMHAGDDRYEAPEGVAPQIIQNDHPILNGVDDKWPAFLGYNILHKKAGAQVLAECKEHVFMAAGEYGKGRTFTFASDIAPHWGTHEFMEWAGYSVLFTNMVKWLANE